MSEEELLAYRFSALERDVQKLYGDVYVGKGKDDPPITARLLQVEKDMGDIRQFLMWIVGISVATFLSVMGFMASQLFHAIH